MQSLYFMTTNYLGAEQRQQLTRDSSGIWAKE